MPGCSKVQGERGVLECFSKQKGKQNDKGNMQAESLKAELTLKLCKVLARS